MFPTHPLIDVPPIVLSPNLPVYLDQSMRYTDYLSITLTALAVMIAILAIVLGIAGFYGYNAIIQLAADRAEKAALKKIEEFLQAVETTEMLKNFVVEKLSDGKAAITDQSPATIKEEPLERPIAKVARRYPKQKAKEDK